MAVKPHSSEMTCSGGLHNLTFQCKPTHPRDHAHFRSNFIPYSTSTGYETGYQQFLHQQEMNGCKNRLKSTRVNGSIMQSACHFNIGKKVYFATPQIWHNGHNLLLQKLQDKCRPRKNYNFYLYTWLNCTRCPKWLNCMCCPKTKALTMHCRCFVKLDVSEWQTGV